MEKVIGPHRLLCGDNLTWLPTLADGSVDLVATDAPYALTSKHCRDGERAGGGFMGKAWDGGLADPRTWEECFRVLKPGGSCLVMMTTRQDCLWRSYRDLEYAGFDLNQTGMWWCYRNGFPKGGDLSKMADARVGAEREVVGQKKFNPRDTKSYVRHGEKNWSGGWGEDGGSEQPTITAPATDLARELDGWFTKGKVKPAVEVIIWARKPNSERTELDNMERWGVGGVNCGACMVPFGEGGEWQSHEATGLATDKFFTRGETPVITKSAHEAGRFPANILVTDTALGPEDSRYFDLEAWSREHGYSDDWAAAAEAGLLQVAKPSRGEKNAGCEGLPATKTFRVNAGGREAKGTDGEWDDVTRRWITQPQSNNHATVKPITLFAYLISFLTKPGATVLDPFAGSGTTLCACAQTGRAGIGMELEEEYFGIMEARVRHWQGEQPEPKQEAQLTLEDMAR